MKIKSKLFYLFLSCRPNQWSKNLLVFAVPFFAFSLDYLVWLVYITTGSIGGNGSIRLPVASVVSGCCRIS